jgi:hypothetical protein
MLVYMDIKLLLRSIRCKFNRCIAKPRIKRQITTDDMTQTQTQNCVEEEGRAKRLPIYIRAQLQGYSLEELLNIMSMPLRWMEG